MANANCSGEANRCFGILIFAIVTKGDSRSGEIWRFQKSVDFSKLGEALGCAGFRVDQPGQLRELLPRAFGMNRPVVIDVVTDENALSEKAWAPGGPVVY